MYWMKSWLKKPASKALLQNRNFRIRPILLIDIHHPLLPFVSSRYISLDLFKGLAEKRGLEPSYAEASAGKKNLWVKKFIKNIVYS